MANGNAGRGRTKGSRNRKTAELLSLAEEGESPAALCLRISKDEAQSLDTRLLAARIVMPFVHSKPQPENPTVEFELQDDIATPQGLLAAHQSILRAVAEGDLPVAIGKDISAMLEAHRRVTETADLEERIRKLEERAGK